MPEAYIRVRIIGVPPHSRTRVAPALTVGKVYSAKLRGDGRVNIRDEEDRAVLLEQEWWERV